jgi:PTS system nitrogen regulatory IIA component
MDNEIMDLDQLASYLQRDARELNKLADRGRLPGMKVGGQWRFASAEIQYWLETQLSDYTDAQLTALEVGASRGGDDSQPLLATLLSEAAVAVPLAAGTKSSLTRELVTLAEQTWQVYDPEAMLAAIKQREDMGSTALDSGVALPHPRRPLAETVQGEAFVAYARTSRGIPFGAPGGGLTDIFFLVCCRDQPTHIRVLTRLARLLLRPGFVEQLRGADTIHDTYQTIIQAESDLLDN